MIVWEGTYTEEDGTQFVAIIRVDADKLAKYFGYGRMGNAVFRKARTTGKAIGTRLRKSVTIDLEKVPE